MRCVFSRWASWALLFWAFRTASRAELVPLLLRRLGAVFGGWPDVGFTAGVAGLTGACFGAVRLGACCFGAGVLDRG